MKDTKELFGLDKNIDEVKSVPPTLNLGEIQIGNEIKVEVISAEPKEQEFKDRTSGELKKQNLIRVIHDGVEKTIWLSSKTLAKGFAKVYEKSGTLKNKKVVIKVREYKHPKYGRMRAYDVLEVLTES